jgi:hypothetical protein
VSGIAAAFGALGIDYGQWLALTRAVLKMDLRVSSIGRSSFNQQAGQRRTSVVAQLVFYIMMGALASMLVFAVRDVMLSGTLVLTYLMFMVGTMVLLDQQSVITSPNDYPVLGFRPISSRTYFAVRVTNVLVYTMALTTAFGLIPLAAFTVGHGFRPLMGLAAVFAFYGSTMFSTLALVFAYAWMLRAIGADRLKRALSYVQLVMGFVIYGGYFMMSQMVSKSFLATWTLPQTSLLLFYPATWFASYLALADGTGTRTAVALAGVSVAAIVALAAGLGGRLSLQYAEELGALTAATAAPAARSSRRRRPVWFRGGEDRAVALLVRAQWRNDQKFRMAVLGILPLTIMYMFMSLQHGPLPDPFTMDLKRTGDTMLVTMAILVFPVTLRTTISRSDAFRASWIYYTAPVERARLLVATKNVIIGFFLLPYLAAVGAAFTYFTGQAVHVALHVAFLGLTSHLILQVVLLASPELPFSQPMQKGTRSGMMILTMIGAMVLAAGLVPLLAAFVYVSPIRIVAGLLALIGAGIGVDRLTRVRVERQAEQLEFGG